MTRHFNSLATENRMQSSTIFFSFTFLLCSPLLSCSALTDTITVSDLLVDNGVNGQTLVSAGKRFELGFFTPTNSSSDHRRYVGIWYYNRKPPTILWVANRKEPLSEEGGVLAIEDGNLKLLYRNGTLIWSTETETSLSRAPVAKLMDSGNLVLSDDQLTMTLWQSFQHPTDTFLPGMKMDDNLTLTSWISLNDPAPGNFTFKQDQGGNSFMIKDGIIPYWKSEESDNIFSSEEMPPTIGSLLSNFSKSIDPTKLKYPFNSTNSMPSENNYARLVLNFTGKLQYWSWNIDWSLIWKEPADRCSVFNACGKFGTCNSNNRLACRCLPGFNPTYPEMWNTGDFSGGCTRNLTSCSKSDFFLSLKKMNVGRPEAGSQITATDESECRNNCLDNCQQCTAYSFNQVANLTRRGTTTSPNCWIWLEDLNNLQEEIPNGHELFVRLAISESTVRNCGFCGTYMIPYPLSTRPNCGDAMYFSFDCNNSTGQLSFKAPSGGYKVISINPTAQRFLIQAKDADICAARNFRGNVLQLNESLPFNVTSWCNADRDDYNSEFSSKGISEIEISWQPPNEPTCNSSPDCKDWPDSTCKVAEDGKKRCLCDANLKWNGLVLNCTGERKDDYNKPLGGPSSSRRQMPLALIVGVTLASVFVLLCPIVYIYVRRRQTGKMHENRENVQRNEVLHLYATERRVKDLIDSGQFKEEDRKAIDLPFFDLESILVATNKFSDANKLGQGGFGPVYKGKFPGGQEIAVKRLLSVSGQGMGEFKNEVVLIAKLQHRNLVRLLGYCIQGDEKILLYEYMPNRSLDSFIFDQTLCTLLDWEMRFDIILGIARGLLYLHQDSRLRIIHRDLKTSNILLDGEMKPKISDFGLAKIFEGKQTEGNTNRVVGTYGYMSPEYALDGFFSVKSDVFSFGVVVLEIVSGKRNTGFYNSKQALSLLGYAWRAWREDRALDLMDQTLRESCNTNEFLKCINVGLLCVQEDPNDRPTMSNVIIMLGSETATLPTPKQPAFVVRRDGLSSDASSSKPETNVALTTSLEAGR